MMEMTDAKSALMDMLRFLKAGDTAGAFKKIADHTILDVLIAIDELTNDLPNERDKKLLGNMAAMLLPDRPTAYHEAGHAVIGRVTGMLCGYSTIERDHDFAGHSIIEDPWDIASDWERQGKFRDISSVFTGRIMA